MKQEKYRKEVLGKLDDQKQITCEECGRKDSLGHAIVDHGEGRVKMVCHDCFKEKYKKVLYGETVGGIH